MMVGPDASMGDAHMEGSPACVISLPGFLLVWVCYASCGVGLSIGTRQYAASRNVPSALTLVRRTYTALLAAWAWYLLRISFFSLASREQGGALKEWCPGSELVQSNAYQAVFNSHLLYRSAVLLESLLVVLGRESLSLLHVLHHLAMYTTAFLWAQWPSQCGMVLLLVNMGDNGLLYTLYTLEGRGLTSSGTRKHIMSYYTDAETVLATVWFLGYAYYTALHHWHGQGGGILFPCGESWVVLSTASVHACVGFYLGLRRQAEPSHMNFKKRGDNGSAKIPPSRKGMTGKSTHDAVRGVMLLVSGGMFLKGIETEQFHLLTVFTATFVGGIITRVICCLL